MGPNYEGRPSYAPQSLLKLYLYGYRNDMRSSRKLARACEVNIEVMWMMGGLRLDFRTISDFRMDNIKSLKGVFREFMERVMVDLKMGFISIDGSKFKAWNSKDRNFTIMKLDDWIKWLEDHTQECLRLIVDYMATNRATDHGLMAQTAESLKKEAGEKIIETVADRGYGQDEEMIACLEKGMIPNVILPDGKDGYDLEVEYREEGSPDPASTDPSELEKCLHAGVVPGAYRDVISDMEIVEIRRKVKDETVEKAESPYGTEEEMRARAAEGYFVRDQERDLVYCSGEETLRKKSIKKNGATRYANKHVCGRCPYKENCVTGKGITRWKEMDFGKDTLEKKVKWWDSDDPDDPNGSGKKKNRGHYEKKKVVRFKFRPDREKMKQRMCISEHPFGTIKRALGVAYFLLKGKQKVSGEFALMAMRYNIARAENMFTFDKLMALVGA